MERPDGLEGDWVAIYVLYEPYDGSVFYVGQAARPRERFRQHLDSPHSAAVALAVRGCWAMPEMGVLAWVPRAEARRHEQAWMDRMRAMGYPIVNGARAHRR